MGTQAYVFFELLMFFFGILTNAIATSYFATAMPSLIFTSIFMITGPLYLAYLRNEWKHLHSEGILNNAIADIFVTKLLKKFRKNIASRSSNNSSRDGSVGRFKP